MGELQSQEYQPNELSLYRDKKHLENASELPYDDLVRLRNEYGLIEKNEWHFLSERQRTEVSTILGRAVFEVSYRRTAEMKEFEEQFVAQSVDAELPQAA